MSWDRNTGLPGFEPTTVGFSFGARKLSGCAADFVKILLECVTTATGAHARTHTRTHANLVGVRQVCKDSFGECDNSDRSSRTHTRTHANLVGVRQICKDSFGVCDDSDRSSRTHAHAHARKLSGCAAGL